jgi:UDP-glucuronate 4-epimerase
MRVLVTGAAGFIGSRTCGFLVRQGSEVYGLDDFNDYYDPQLKFRRLAALAPEVRVERVDIGDPTALAAAFDACRPTHVVHLAAQAGAGASIANPARTVHANLVGFANILQECRLRGVEHLVFASSSSVYGLDRALPFSERVGADHPITLYGATKRANELMAHSHAHLFGLPCTGLRFFTVYGPWGRPDMVLSRWTSAILRGEPIRLFNEGRSTRDFTYIDDVAEAIVRALARIARPEPTFDPVRPDPATSSAPYRLYNVACGQTVPLRRYIEVLEACLCRKAETRIEPIQPGDVPDTTADISDLVRDFGFRPSTPVEVGIPRFVAWYRDHHRT